MPSRLAGTAWAGFNAAQGLPGENETEDDLARRASRRSDSDKAEAASGRLRRHAKGRFFRKTA